MMKSARRLGMGRKMAAVRSSTRKISRACRREMEGQAGSGQVGVVLMRLPVIRAEMCCQAVIEIQNSAPPDLDGTNIKQGRTKLAIHLLIAQQLKQRINFLDLAIRARIQRSQSNIRAFMSSIFLEQKFRQVTFKRT